MRVFGFFEGLENLDEGRPEWNNLVAGLAVLRAAESVLDHDCACREIIDRSHGYVAPIASTPLRGILTALLDATRPDAYDNVEDRRRAISKRLMAYGLWLHAEALYAPAADVFEVVGAFDAGEPDLLMQAAFSRAFALRLLRRFDDAKTAYAHLADLADRHASHPMAIEAELGIAKLAIDQGNIPAAIPLVDAAIMRAFTLGQTYLLAKALLDRARIAGIQHDAAGVLWFSSRAAAWLHRGSDRDRALMNMAIAFREIEMPADARDLARYVATAGHYEEERIAAILLLYHLAIDEKDTASASMCRACLSGATLSSVFAAEYYEAMGRDLFVMREAPEESAAALGRMLAVAEEHRLEELIFRAEKALADVRAGREPAIYAFHPVRVAPDAEHMVATVQQSIAALCSA